MNAVIREVHEFTCTGCGLLTATMHAGLTLCDECHDATQVCERCEKRVPAGTLLKCRSIDICEDCEDETGWHRHERRRLSEGNSQDQADAEAFERYLGIGR